LPVLGAVPPCTYQSLPIPVPGPSGLSAAFMYGRSALHVDGGISMEAPRYLARIDAETGALEELRLLERDAAGDLPAQPLAAPSDAAEAHERRARLLHAYDVLMPEFAAGRTRLPMAVASTAAGFEPLFREVAEQPLLPHYMELGRAFFLWLTPAAT